MSRAYLLILIPAAVVGVSYFLIFHSLGMAVGSAPFLGTLVVFVVALFAVRHYHRSKRNRSHHP